jgi:hypothetical protein
MQEGRVPQASDARGQTARSLRVAGEGAAAGLPPLPSYVPTGDAPRGQDGVLERA